MGFTRDSVGNGSGMRTNVNVFVLDISGLRPRQTYLIAIFGLWYSLVVLLGEVFRLGQEWEQV